MGVINKEVLLQGLQDFFDVPELKTKIEALQNAKFNPFKLDAEGTPQGWQVFTGNLALLNYLILQAIKTVETTTYEAGEVAKGKEKLDAVAEFFDKVIELPFYFEWVDGPLIKMVIAFGADQLNQLFGKDWIQHIPKPSGD